MHAAVGPRIAHAHVARAGVVAGGSVCEDAKDALGEAPQLLAIDLVGATEVVDDLRDRAPALGVPGVLGELVVAHLRSVRVAALRRA